MGRTVLTITSSNSFDISILFYSCVFSSYSPRSSVLSKCFGFFRYFLLTVVVGAAVTVALALAAAAAALPLPSSACFIVFVSSYFVIACITLQFQRSVRFAIAKYVCRSYSQKLLTKNKRKTNQRKTKTKQQKQKNK